MLLVTNIQALSVQALASSIDRRAPGAHVHLTCADTWQYLLECMWLMMPCGIACMPVVLCGMQQVTLCLLGSLLIKRDQCLHLVRASYNAGRPLTVECVC